MSGLTTEDGDHDSGDAPALEHDESRDTAFPDGITGTPAARQDTSLPPSGSIFGSISRPTTRSVTRLQSAASLLGPKTNLFGLSSKAPSNGTNSRLEDARDIEYDDGEENGEAANDGSETTRVGQKRKALVLSTLRGESKPRAPARRSTRINLRRNGSERDATPQDAEVVKSEPPPKRSKRTAVGRKLALRRSVRLAKPLTQFHKYSDLPPELRLCIWDAAVTPRLVYLRNQAAPNPSYDVQTKQPRWFMTSKISAHIAKASYRKMFSLRNYVTSPASSNTAQLVSPDDDIIVLEPCCTGCRGYHCSRHMYCEADRSAIRFLAVQTENPMLSASTMACWATVNLAWPNVETLYLIKDALKGDHKEDLAIVRIAEGDREIELRKKFDEWKKGTGSDKKMTKLEFVVVVDKEAEDKALKDRYQTIESRNTGLPEDIIME